MKGWILASIGLLLTGTPAWADEPAAATQQELPAVKTVYVHFKPSKSDRISRATALIMTEMLTKEINMHTPYRVIGSPDQADLILEAKFRL